MSQPGGTAEPDVVVIGAGLMGALMAWGLARRGLRVTVLDEDDAAQRASRANFALVWVQGKGADCPDYAAWSRSAAEAWSELAGDLRAETGIDVGLDQPGGFTLCLSDREMDANADLMRRLHNRTGGAAVPYEVLDHAATRALLPDLGREVVGSIFCPLDGHVNSLRLFRASHAAMTRSGVAYRARHPVTTIRPLEGGFAVAGAWGEVRAARVLLAAGLGNERLAPQVGLAAPTRVSRGQIIVTEKLRPFLRHPVVTIRQTDEGGVMIGDSEEGHSTEPVTNPAISAVMADRALRMFPLLAEANVVRTWATLRVMTPDGLPLYERSAAFPGAFVAMAHSGVSLAPHHAGALADAMARGTWPPAGIDAFSAGRFHVPASA